MGVLTDTSLDVAQTIDLSRYKNLAIVPPYPKKVTYSCYSIHFTGIFMSNDPLDRFDRAILEHLQHDASMSAAEVGESVGLSQSPCWRRINRLESRGVITRRVALLDRRKLGLDVLVFAMVKLTAHGRRSLPEFAETIQRYPQVLECYTLMGEMDFLLRIVMPDVYAYERFFFEELSQFPGVQEVHSNIALSEIKSTTELPLDEIQ